MRQLSKSQYVRGLKCLKALYLYRERKDLADAVTPDAQARFDQGTEVGILAQQLFPGGTLIKADYRDPDGALAETKAAVAAGAGVLYEAAYQHDDVLIRADIMVNTGPGAWSLYEVKSSTEVEDTYLDDVAIQRHVLKGAGVKLDRAHVVILNKAYERRGALDLQALFLPVDVTADSEDRLAAVPRNLAAMKAAAGAAAAPDAAIGARCWTPYDCDFTGHCWAKVPDYSVWDLAGAQGKKKAELWNAGIETVAEIPDDVKLNDYQKRQRFAAASGQTHVDVAAVRAFLATLTYPVHHLDFETFAAAIPPYDGTHPYQQLPFQASLHVQAFRRGPVVHHEYLADGTQDPRLGLAHFLLEHVGGTGAVVAYHKSFEGGILKALAAWYDKQPEKNYLLDMETRLWDLAEPFKKAMYAAPAFKGSWSIKAVLPALVPSMTYKGMEIANGADAMRAYARLMGNDVTPAERAKTMTDLLAYCGTDTMAMVRILEHLEEVVTAKA